MDLKQIEELMSAMKKAGIKKLILKKEEFAIELERESLLGGKEIPVSLPPEKKISVEEKQPPPPSSPEKEGHYVTSPMVGTFYSAPSPESPPYIKEGDSVDENTVVCIVEAMKVMNEIKSGVKGTVVEVLVKNGDPLEFGTKILRVI